MEFAIVYFEVVNVIKELHNIDKAFEMSFQTMDPEICLENCSYRGGYLSGICLCEVSVIFYFLFTCKLI